MYLYVQNMFYILDLLSRITPKVSMFQQLTIIFTKQQKKRGGGEFDL